MIRVARRLEKEGRESKMLLTVHDELVFEAPEGERDDVARLAKEEMEGACELKVPLVVDVGWGPTWADAH